MHPALERPYEPLTPDNCALVLIDHQMGLMLPPQSINLELLRRNTLGLAKVAKLFKLPTVVTSGGSRTPGRGFNGPLFPELADILPAAPVIERTSLNAWLEPKVVAAVKATGRRKLLMGGISTDICLTYATVSAADAGYEVYFVADVSSTWDPRAEQTAWMRMAQRGVILTNLVSVPPRSKGTGRSGRRRPRNTSASSASTTRRSRGSVRRSWPTAASCTNRAEVC